MPVCSVIMSADAGLPFTLYARVLTGTKRILLLTTSEKQIRGYPEFWWVPAQFIVAKRPRFAEKRVITAVRNLEVISALLIELDHRRTSQETLRAVGLYQPCIRRGVLRCITKGALIGAFFSNPELEKTNILRIRGVPPNVIAPSP